MSSRTASRELPANDSQAECTSSASGGLQADAVREALLRTLRLIVAGVRVHSPDVERQCEEFADTFAQCLRDEATKAYLRAMTEFEQLHGVSTGAAN